MFNIMHNIDQPICRGNDREIECDNKAVDLSIESEIIDDAAVR